MKKWSSIIAVFTMALLGSLSPAKADTVTTLGSQEFTPGTFVGVGTFNGDPVVMAQSAPFNAFIGSSPSGPNFSGTWTFTYLLPASSTVTGATLTIGIIDSPWEGKVGNSTPANTDQVASFVLNGTDDLTALLNTEINTVGTGKNILEVDQITIPTADLAALGSNSAMFSLTLQGPGNGVLGPTPFLGAALDFSTLDITTESSVVTPTPEPSTWLLLCTGMLSLGLARMLLKQS